MSEPPLSPTWDEPEQARPWRPEDGPEPRMTLYPHGKRPRLLALVNGRWLPMSVEMREDRPDGRVAYHGVIALPDPHDPHHRGGYERAYLWPQPGKLRAVR